MRCGTCWHRCVVAPGETGLCRTRENRGGRLYTLVYGRIAALSANPTDKKPLFHFYPGTRALTAGTRSCNFVCPWCQNHRISKVPPPPNGDFIDPEEFVRLARRHHCAGTSLSFNEPTLLLEYALDLFPLARRAGLYNTYVSNGYMTPEALDLLCAAGLDAINIDIKGEAPAVRQTCGADVERIWQNVLAATRRGVHVELTTLIVPGVNDREDVWRAIARRIVAELGTETSWHVTRYHPAYRFRTATFVPPTPVGVLNRAREAGLSEGLRFVNVGNVPGHRAQNTYCPDCTTLLIARDIFTVTACRVTPDNRCPECGGKIPLRR
ncbi:MAG: AmmeMemoRadiSam system radical SAM enzyme [Desulfotomaculales bacterium]